MALENFEPMEFIGSMGADPAEGTKWRTWFAGNEPKISRPLALVMWETLSEAEGYFVKPSQEWRSPEKYEHEHQASAVLHIEQDLSLFLNKIEILLAHAGKELLSPIDFECVTWHDKDLDKNIVRTLSAYSIFCLDKSITGLLSGQADLATLGYAYAAVGVDMCWTYMQQLNPSSGIQKIIRSDVAQRNARARHRETHALEDEVIAYWQTNIDPALSNEKAAIALTKVFPLSARTLSKYISKVKQAPKQKKPD